MKCSGDEMGVFNAFSLNVDSRSGKRGCLAIQPQRSPSVPPVMSVVACFKRYRRANLVLYGTNSAQRCIVCLIGVPRPPHSVPCAPLPGFIPIVLMHPSDAPMFQHAGATPTARIPGPCHSQLPSNPACRRHAQPSAA